MPQTQSNYAAELEQEELQLIAATLAMMRGIIPPGMLQFLASQFLSESPQFTFAEVEIICASLQAMSRQIGRDRVLPRTQIETVQRRAALIVQKLERGMGHGGNSKAF